MNDGAIEHGTRRKPSGQLIALSIIGAALIAALAAAFDYTVMHLAGSLTPGLEAFLVFIGILMLFLVVAMHLGYIVRSNIAISAIFICLSIFFMTWFVYALFFVNAPEIVTRHMSWVIAILIIPFLILNRTRARRFGGALCGGMAIIIIAHIVQRGVNPFTDPVCADLIIFLLSLGASWLLLDGFAVFRESAIRFQARSLAFEETATIMKDAAETAEKGREEAEKSIKLREIFLATMSHELRTPLNAIIGFSEMMKSGSLGDKLVEKYRAYATDIHQSGEHVLGLINQLLEYSRIQSGTFDLEISPVCLEDVAGQVHRMMTSIAEKKGVVLVADWDGATETWVSADRQGLVQIALNLLGNAIKFTKSGGSVTLKIEKGSGARSVLSVSDTGAGIAQDKLTEVCQPFVRLGDATLASETGTGLGLAIVTTLVASMGSQFTLESELGKGTIARVWLPAVRSSKTATG